MQETWRPVLNFEGVYEVSDAGRVRRVGKVKGVRVGRILSTAPNRAGYPCANLWRSNKITRRFVHVLVAEAFIGPKPHGLDVNHKDGRKSNNDIRNLEYVTRSENNIHAYQTGLQPVGEARSRAKLTAAQVSEILSLNREGIGCRRLARQFGVCKQAISLILQGKNWKHIGRSL